jgi:spermidine dehydrogenase
MDMPITRRDFLSGASVAVTGSLLAPGWIAAGSSAEAAASNAADYYPPTLTGLRGSHPGSFDVAHKLRDGALDAFGSVADTGENYDLIVVGGGISGLAAAYFYRKEVGPKAKILVLDNHDDFGGHAKRNEFHHNGRLLVDLGGTEFIERPSAYPPEASALLRELGIDVSKAEEVYDHDLYRSLGLRGAIFFDEETFGTDQLVIGGKSVPQPSRSFGYGNLPAELAAPVGDRARVEAFMARTPLNERAKREIVRLFSEPVDYLPNLSQAEKQQTLATISYQEFLTNIVGVHPDVVAFFRHWETSYQGIGIDTTPALYAHFSGLPGLTELVSGEGYNGHSQREDFHFPDGNASVARALVRAVVPPVAPGKDMNDIVTARFDYGRLDEEGAPVRIRLNSTAVNVRHVGDPASSKEIEVTYVRLRQGTARACRSVRTRLLQRDHSPPVSGATSTPERCALLRHPDAAGLDQRSDPKLAILS